jgi:hypothetical protein
MVHLVPRRNMVYGGINVGDTFGFLVLVNIR